jgi:outer membrane immunogenic protein
MKQKLKQIKKIIPSIAFVLVYTQVSFAESSPRKSLRSQLQSLGSSSEVSERVKNMDSQQRVRVVQNRSVERNNRVELGLNYGLFSNADSYVQTQNAGAALQYHVSPRFSFGFEYQRSFNKMTPEGDRQFSQAQALQQKDPGNEVLFPGVDYPLDTKMAMATFYPIYGKLNLFDSGIAQFDLYTSLGAGQMALRSGSTQAFMAGLGAGVWLNNYLSMRLEGRYQKYRDLVQSQNRDQNTFQALASMGIFLW